MENKQRALLIIHPSRSHINATRKLVEFLKKDFKLAVCGSTNGKRMMEVFDVKVYCMESMPIGSGFESFLCYNNGQYDYLCELKMRKSMELFKRRVASLTSILTDWNPAIFFIDILYITDLLIVRRWLGDKSDKIFLIRTKPSLCKTKYTIPSTFSKIY